MGIFNDQVDEIQRKIELSKNDDAKVIGYMYEFMEKYIDFRNRQMKMMKFYSPTKQRIVKLRLVEMDNMFAQFKHKLRDFENSCEEELKAKAEREEALNRHFEKAERISEKLYIIIKHQSSKELFDKFHDVVTQDMTSEELNEFLERIDHLEQTELEDILSGK